MIFEHNLKDLIGQVLDSHTTAIVTPLAAVSIPAVSVLLQFQAWVTVTSAIGGCLLIGMLLRHHYLRNRILEIELESALEARERRKAS